MQKLMEKCTKSVQNIVENISSQEKITYLPIYLIGFLEKEKIEEYIYSIDLSALQ